MYVLPSPAAFIRAVAPCLSREFMSAFLERSVLSSATSPFAAASTSRASFLFAYDADGNRQSINAAVKDMRTAGALLPICILLGDVGRAMWKCVRPAQ